MEVWAAFLKSNYTSENDLAVPQKVSDHMIQ